MANSIHKSVDLNANIDRVWHSLTNYEAFGEWFRVKIDTPFAVGAKSTGHITYSGYEHLKWEATIKDMREPHYFAFYWHPYAVDPSIDYSKENPTLVEFKLEPIETGTRLTVTESGFDAIPADRMPIAYEMNEGGWAEQMNNIRDYLENK